MAQNRIYPEPPMPRTRMLAVPEAAIWTILDWYEHLPNDELPQDQAVRRAFAYLNSHLGNPSK